MEGLLQNKVILIVGGTSGLGLSAAGYFKTLGAKLAIVGSNPEKIERVKKLLGSSSLYLQGDAAEEKTSEDAVRACVATHGTIDGLYHVAGGSGRKWGDGPLHTMTLEAWNKTLELNLNSVMISNRAAVKYFLESKRPGTILNMSSVLAYSPAPHYFSTHAYATAKAGIIGFSRSLASYYAKYNIRVNVIAPALFETPMAERAARYDEILEYIKTKQPLDGGRIGNPRDADLAAAYFLSDQSGFTTGQVLSVDGGWSVSEGQYGSQNE